MKIIILAALSAALVGCASDPTNLSDADDAAAQTASLAPAPASAAADPAQPKEFKPPKGYKRRMADGQAVYCTKMVVLGSRFPKDDCRTQAELEDLEDQKASMRGGMDQSSRVCASAAGCQAP